MKKVLTAVLALFITMPVFAQEDKSFGEAFNKITMDYCYELVNAEYDNAVKFIRTKYLNNTQGEFPSHIDFRIRESSPSKSQDMLHPRKTYIVQKRQALG
jgi:hypothetical protein